MDTKKEVDKKTEHKDRFGINTKNRLIGTGLISVTTMYFAVKFIPADFDNFGIFVGLTLFVMLFISGFVFGRQYEINKKGY